MTRETFIAAVDADTLLFAPCTWCQKNTLVATGIATGETSTHKNITAFKGTKTLVLGGWIAKENVKRVAAGLPEWERSDFTFEKVAVKHGPEVIEKAKTAIQNSIQAILEKPWVEDIRIVIGGQGNYREHIAFTQPYKNTRPPKPLAFLELKEWMIGHFGEKMVIVDGVEADDVVATFGWWGYNRAKFVDDLNENPIVMIHTDKDINQVPGWHWNKDSGSDSPHWIDETQAARYFWIQMLTGDTTDCIPGLPGVTQALAGLFGIKGRKLGPVNAGKVIDRIYDERKIATRVLFCYKEYYDENPYPGKTWVDMVNEQFGLLRLQEKKETIPLIQDYVHRLKIDLEGF
jgi:hypothetical protein